MDKEKRPRLISGLVLKLKLFYFVCQCQTVGLVGNLKTKISEKTGKGIVLPKKVHQRVRRNGVLAVSKDKLVITLIDDCRSSLALD